MEVEHVAQVDAHVRQRVRFVRPSLTVAGVVRGGHVV